MKATLFLGMPLQQLQQHTTASLFKLFTQEPYLQLIEQEEIFVGKFLSSTPSLEEVELMHTHVLSIIKKMTPSYVYQEDPLSLIPCYGRD